MESPLISVIVPTKDRPDLLRRALASIAAQDVAHGIEAIVVDDGSAEPQEWVRAYADELGLELTFVRHEVSRDLAGARNAGLRVARGKYVGYLDDDDLWLPHHARVLLAAVEGSHARAAYGLAERWAQELRDGAWVTVDSQVEHRQPRLDMARLLLTNLTPVNTVLHERSLIDEIGGFDETLTVIEDWDLWIRMRDVTDFVHVPQVTCAYTTRPAGNMTQERLLEFWPAQARIFARYAPLAARHPGLDKLQQASLDTLAAQFPPPLVETLRRRAAELAALPPSNATLHAAPDEAATGSAGDEPLVSICIPTFQRCDLLREALGSARAQTWPNLEILVSDDGSTDGTHELLEQVAAEDARVRWWSNEENVGGRENHRVLLREARGEYVKFLNDDDLLHVANVARLVRPMIDDPTLTVATSKRQLIDERGVPMADTSHSRAITTHAQRLPGADLVNLCLTSLTNWVGEPTTVLFRRDAVAASTMFSFGGRHFDASADLALWFSLLSRGDAWYDPHPLSSLRLHGTHDSQPPSIVVELLTDFLAFIERAPQYGFLLEGDDVRTALCTLLARVAGTYAPLHDEPAAAELPALIERIGTLLAAQAEQGASTLAPQATVVIPVHDDVDALVATVSSIADGTPGSWFEVVFVDDAASDACRGLLDALEGDIRVVRHEERRGLLASYAAGIAVARGDLTALVEPGAVLEPGWLPALGTLLTHDAALAAAVPAVIDADERDVRDFDVDRDAVAALVASSTTLRAAFDECSASGSLAHVARDLAAAGRRIGIDPASRASRPHTARAASELTRAA
ncbi:MAG: hypothetical protein JWO69_593 [Thermoleophilia bacterium]|nr:hypothetical protein [Thermoleophilia bacterium]